MRSINPGRHCYSCKVDGEEEAGGQLLGKLGPWHGILCLVILVEQEGIGGVVLLELGVR